VDIHSGFIDSVVMDSRCLCGNTARTGMFRGVLQLPYVAILLLCGCFGGCTMATPGAGSQPPDVTALNARFRTLAFEQLSFKLERSSPLSPPAQRAIEEFIAGGARRLSAEGATPERISLAEANINRFVSGLSEQADVGEQGDISPETVAVTRNRLCPLYPFC
jgi:hypothetical protein